MSRRLKADVRDWLRAEETGSDELAERWLARVLTDLGRNRPRAGFADRVLVRAGRLSPASQAWRSWWTRAGIAACLVAAGLAVATLPTWLLVADPLARAFGAPVTAAVWHLITRWTVAAFALWALVVDIGSATRVWLGTPAGAGLLAVNLAIACGSLMGLRQLLKAPEELEPW
jgi:hypothetical protein